MRNARAIFPVGAGLLTLALLLPRSAAAAWPIDPLANVPLCTATSEQDYPTSVPDGAGGVIVTWVDYRNGDGDIYAQRISADGVPRWTADGVALCSATGAQLSPAIIADGGAPGEAGSGAIVTWQDHRSDTDYDIYAQRISADGVPQWTADGVALCSATGNQWNPALVSDSGSGAIIVWQDQRSDSNDDLYAQRILASGAVAWTADGVALCSATGWQKSPAIVPDGAGGAIVAWDDYRSGDYDIYAQRISSTGALPWTANGVSLCSAAGGQYSPAIAPDGASGAIVTWFDQRSGNYDIYAQRILAGGSVHWAANGVALCADPGEQYYPAIIADGASGAIVTWFDSRSGDYDIYAQKVSSAGATRWTANGVTICAAGGTQWYPTIIADSAAAGEGGSGAIIAWTDSRNATDDIYAQRISTGGTVQWTADGAALCNATGWQELGAIVPDDGAGAIATWVDGRSGNLDIYAQRVLANGTLGGGSVEVADEPAPAPAFALEPVRPNPSRGTALMVRFTLPSAAPAAIDLLDVAGRRITAREVGSLGAGRHALDLGAGRDLAPGLYLVRLRQGADTRVTRVAVLM
jgi:hypothetical protein